MSSYPAAFSFDQLLASFAQAKGLPFADLLSQEQLLQHYYAVGSPFSCQPNQSLSPALTLSAWLSQCLDADKSCRAAVARLRAVRVSLGQPTIGPLGTSSYCRARQKLPLALPRLLAQHSGQRLEQDCPEAWRWHDRRVILADGSTVSMPDTDDNQKVYPQPTTQKPGLGFPLMRLVALIGLASGAVLGCASGPYAGKKTGEAALLRRQLDLLRPRDVLVADRCHCSYWLLAMLRKRGVDVCVRLHQCRLSDFSSGRRLGPDDHLACWHKPKRPDWLSQADYDEMPATLTVREVRKKISNRVGEEEMLVVVTSLLDDEAYPVEDIYDLYKRRWTIELDLRSIKAVMGMDILSCRTAEMVQKEMWMHLLAYNLMRAVIARSCQMKAEAAEAAEAALPSEPSKPRKARQATKAKKPRRRTGSAKPPLPHEVSFKAAVQAWRPFAVLLMREPEASRAKLTAQVIADIAGQRVGKRPGRQEPRKVKRRQSKYSHLSQPREQERQKRGTKQSKR